MENKNLISFNDCEPFIGMSISMVWEDGSTCECVYNGLNKEITPLPTHWYPIRNNYRELLQTFLPDEFRGLDKQYMIQCVFNEEIQKNWIPKIGDITISLMADIYVLESDNKVSECAEHIKEFRYVPYPNEINK